MGAFGGSYLNHQYLVCACAPIYPNAPDSPARGLIAETQTDAKGEFLRLIPGKDNPASVLDGRPQYKRYGNITPKEPDGTYRAVNTMVLAQHLLGSAARQLIGQGAEAIVLACTEVPLALGPQPVPLLDSTRLLAEATLRWAGLDVSPRPQPPQA